MIRITGFVCLAAALPAYVSARSTGPPVQRTGATIDGGLNCTGCHRTFAPANQDPRGSVALEAVSYTPGSKQILKITVAHPDAKKWGFELTARLASDPGKQAGTFTVTDLIRVQCEGATDAPCNGKQEFASHNRNSYGLGSNGRETFQVEWTPPAQDVGDIVFFFAGNAANGDGTNQGDVIYTSKMVVRSAAGCDLPRPIISGVGNAASGSAGTAYNGLFTVYGSNFLPAGRSRVAQDFDIANNRFPTQLECLAVEVAGQRVPLTFANATQVNAAAPTVNDDLTVEVRVIANPGSANERRSEDVRVTHARQHPGFFTFNGKSIAALSADLKSIIADPAVVAGARAAKAGEVISLFLTGCGLTDPVYQAGEVVAGQARVVGSGPTVQIGGTTLAAADILYAGLTPGSISGLYQLNVTIPADAPAGDIPVTVKIGSATTQAGTTIPVVK